MSFTNGQQPRIAGTLSGLPLRVESNIPIDTTTTAVGDLVGVVTSGAWVVYAADGTAFGGQYLGRDAGSISSGGVTLATPGINASGPGVQREDGSTGEATTVTKGAVAMFTNDTLLEIDIVENATMTTIVPGFTGLELQGSTRVSASSGGWCVALNASSGTDNCCTVVEVLRPSTTTLRGRALVCLNTSAITKTG
jgi:hypothetical protein